MGFPVTIDGSATCAHPPGAATLTSDVKLTVKSKPVLLFSAAAKLGPYAGCTAPDTRGKCVTTAVLTPNPGQSRKLTVGGSGNFVLLADLQATSLPPSNDPATATPVTVSAGQAVLTAS